MALLFRKQGSKGWVEDCFGNILEMRTCYPSSRYVTYLRLVVRMRLLYVLCSMMKLLLYCLGLYCQKLVSMTTGKCN